MRTRAPKNHGTWSLWLWAILVLTMAVGHTVTLRTPSERLGGLTPGKDTIRDAEHCFGACDIIISGTASYYAGGSQASRAYLWSGNELLNQRGLTIETSLTSRRIELIMVDLYPGIGTSCDLMALDPECAVTDTYGIPDYAYAVRVPNGQFRELFYIDKGLLIVLSPLSGRSDWVVNKLILTYPAFLRNGVAARTQYAQQRRGGIEDISHHYRVWARIYN